MPVPGCSSEISRLLRMKGVKRLGVKNEFTERILEMFNLKAVPGIRLKFLETIHRETDYGSWDEYKILLEALKLEEHNLEYLGVMMGNVHRAIQVNLRETGIVKQGEDVDVGLQEVECSIPNYYYFLIYINSNGKEKEN